MERIKEQMVYMYLCQNHRGKDSLIKNKELWEKLLELT